MHTIDDRPNGILLNHSADWVGRVRIAWYVTDERRELEPPPLSLRECWCSGPDLVAGLFTPTSAGPLHTTLAEPPINVITRAVALAVEDYLRYKLASVVDNDLFIRRGKL